MKENEYKCNMCMNVYEKEWTDEDAHTEATEIFGSKPEDWNCGQSIICDDCFKKINPRKYPGLVLAAKMEAVQENNK